MRPTALITDIPLSAAFRYWGDERDLKEAYELKMRARCERDIDRRSRHNELVSKLVQRASRTVWKKLEWDPSLTATGIKLLLGSIKGREKLKPELISKLTPNFTNSSAESELVKFCDIKVSGDPPFWISMTLDDEIWGTNPSDRFIANLDYRQVQLGGKLFQLGKVQAEIVCALHFRYMEGKPIVSMKEVLNGRIGHVRDYFKGDKQSLIAFPARGFVSLNLS